MLQHVFMPSPCRLKVLESPFGYICLSWPYTLLLPIMFGYLTSHLWRFTCLLLGCIAQYASQATHCQLQFSSSSFWLPCFLSLAKVFFFFFASFGRLSSTLKSPTLRQIFHQHFLQSYHRNNSNNKTQLIFLYTLGNQRVRRFRV